MKCTDSTTEKFNDHALEIINNVDNWAEEFIKRNPTFPARELEYLIHYAVSNAVSRHVLHKALDEARRRIEESKAQIT
jgi:hypothetical protein